MAYNTGTQRESKRSRAKAKKPSFHNGELPVQQADAVFSGLEVHVSRASEAVVLVGRDCLDTPKTRRVTRFCVPLIPFTVIVLDSAIERHSGGSAKAPIVSIPALPKLLERVAIERVCTPRRFAQQEIAFLRKTLMKTGRQFAKLLEVAPETISRWENGRDPMGPHPERLLRLHILNAFASHMPGYPSLMKCAAEMNIAPVSNDWNEEVFLFKYARGEKDIRHWIRVGSRDRSATDSTSESICEDGGDHMKFIDLPGIVAAESRQREIGEFYSEE